MRILVTILLCLWMNVVSAAPNWEAVDGDTWIDTASIKVIQVDYDELVKVNTKANSNGCGYSLMTMVINKDTLWWAASVMEFYDTNGKLTSKYTNDVRDRHWWIDGTKSTLVGTLFYTLYPLFLILLSCA